MGVVCGGEKSRSFYPRAVKVFAIFFCARTNNAKLIRSKSFARADVLINPRPRKIPFRGKPYIQIYRGYATTKSRILRNNHNVRPSWTIRPTTRVTDRDAKAVKVQQRNATAKVVLGTAATWAVNYSENSRRGPRGRGRQLLWRSINWLCIAARARARAHVTHGRLTVRYCMSELRAPSVPDRVAESLIVLLSGNETEYSLNMRPMDRLKKLTSLPSISNFPPQRAIEAPPKAATLIFDALMHT